MKNSNPLPNRREVLTATLAGTVLVTAESQDSSAHEISDEPLLEKLAKGTPHLVKEGYMGYLVRATKDDMGDAPGLGTPGSIGDHVLGNERDNAEVARVLGLKKVFDLNYSNHRMADVSLNELICRLIFLIRLLKVDTVVCWDPWAHDEENPDHTQDRARHRSRVLDGRPGSRLSRTTRRGT